MSRSKWKGPFIQSCLLKKKVKRTIKPIVIWSRSSVILKSFVNKKVLVHNGKTFRTFYVKANQVGFKFGEFSFTRKLKKKNAFRKNTNKKPKK
jgi:small subunit ribosomal protein S19